MAAMKTRLVGQAWRALVVRSFVLVGFVIGLSGCTAEGPESTGFGASTNGTGGSTGAGGPADTSVPAITTTVREDASRFLSQATFGPHLSEIEAFGTQTPASWLLAEFEKPETLVLPKLLAQPGDLPNDAARNLFWTHAITADDQLRQRMAFALSQILVTSQENTVLRQRPFVTAHYMDILAKNAFGNYRDLLEEVTYSPMMAVYLTYLKNRPADPATGRVPDENYAREIMQLFTIGLVELHEDGTPKLDTMGEPIETYDNNDVTGLAKVFTGLGFDGHPFFRGIFGVSQNDPRDPGLYSPLIFDNNQHSSLEKTFLDVTIPPGTDGPASIDIALDALVDHPNTPPFIARQLLQRFTTSNPTPGYVFEVANAFKRGTYRLPDGGMVGDGRRGDMKATIAAILLSRSAREAPDRVENTFGKMREPVIRFTHWARAFSINSADVEPQGILNNTGAGRLGQQPYRSPSVFNFYRPGYVPPGTEMGDLGLTVPEFQIADAGTVIGSANYLDRFIRSTNNIDPASFQPDYTAELALAGDPAALVDHLDLIFTYGSMSDDMRQRIVELLNEIDMPAGDMAAARDRVHAAIAMVVTSTDYQILD